MRVGRGTLRSRPKGAIVSNRRILANVIAALLLALAAVGISRQGEAVGTTEVYRVKPPAWGTLAHYGMHFDEVGATYFMARDWSMSGTTQHRVYLQDSMAIGTRWRFTDYGSCGVAAQAGYVDGYGQWHGYAGETIHYEHLGSRVPNYTVSAPMTNVGFTYESNVGVQANCNTNEVHVHQSADIASGTPLYRYVQDAGNDTCWSDTVNGTQCPSYYKEDYAPWQCPGGWSGNMARPSGNITKYRCEEWSLLYWYYDAPLVVAKW